MNDYLAKCDIFLLVSGLKQHWYVVYSFLHDSKADSMQQSLQDSCLASFYGRKKLGLSKSSEP